MSFACISIGSNLGEPSNQVEKAIELLAGIPETALQGRSKLYRTEPWGRRDQPDFMNAVAGLETQLTPLELLDELQGIEELGRRVRNEKWGPRTLDLDVICYDQLDLDHPRLKLPHPLFSQRLFVLEPMKELYPELFISEKTVHTWFEILNETGGHKGSLSG